ncbi:MAG: extracellular solute-binding protein [Lachnospiraceae bacterium]|nr:extracellular solute-binding protein [Lachnospiraceae bacterium]MDE6981064.1 extracellular solute-binding protein [Lachnospiraceae bacterium]
MRKKHISAIVGIAVAASFFSGCSERLTDPRHPVSLTVWHYYNGSQQEAFQGLVEEFNDTAGKEMGIHVQSMSKGSVGELEQAVQDSMEGKVGADEVPDMFSAYADTAYLIEQQGKLANISDYITEEEIGEYVDSYIKEGYIAQDGGLRIFPVAKSTEILMINQTDWDVFAEETGASPDGFSTLEGIVKLAEEYYNWTDGKTPDVEGDGKALYGRDSMANYFVIGMRQQGTEIFQVEEGKVTVNDDKEKIRRLWDNYYVPYIKGYFASYGSFRSDDVKTGDLLAYTGSTASAMYFPDQIETNEGSKPIEYSVMSAPVLEGGESIAIQQGAGIVVTKSEKAREYASVEFLKWMTQAKPNIRFGCEAGYLPVKKDAIAREKLDEVIGDNQVQVSDKIYACLSNVLDQSGQMELYACQSFAGASDARKVLEYSLSDKAVEDREQVVKSLKEGSSLEEACGPFLTEECFEAWYESFDKALREAVQ